MHPWGAFFLQGIKMTAIKEIIGLQKIDMKLQEIASLLGDLPLKVDALKDEEKSLIESLENGKNRLKELEELALSKKGVLKAYALQAGRELRVIVESEYVSDQQAKIISYDLSRQIQEEMTYPGQVKITVIRETRSVNIAK